MSFGVMKSVHSVVFQHIRTENAHQMQYAALIAVSMVGLISMDQASCWCVEKSNPEQIGVTPGHKPRARKYSVDPALRA
jgi:hypothetical protein